MSRHASARQLSAYLDGELPKPQLRLVERHLEECPPCRERLAGLRRTVASLRRLERLAPPPALGEDVARRVRLEPRPRGLLERLEARLGAPPLQSAVGFTFALVLAFAVLLVLFAGWVDERGRREREAGPRLVAPSEIVGAEDFVLPEDPPATRRLRADAEEAAGWIAANPEIGRLLERGLPVLLRRDGEVIELLPVDAARARLAAPADGDE